MASQVRCYLQKISLTERNSNGCSEYERLSHVEKAINQLGVLKDFEHILAYAKIPYRAIFEDIYMEMNEYILREVCITKKQVSTGARAWIKTTELSHAPQPQKSGCSYPFFTEAVVSKSQERDIFKPYIEYNVCTTESTCYINAAVVNSDLKKIESPPTISGCTFSIYKPLFAIPAYFPSQS
ncbi:hypothetical protein AX774_g6073 [Zancudomyces culisetae]|uniref:Uncharacterized protein n=1 Tax=Zancudomyces culisetae TaxID=1213189 RepID=A0A1R1PHN9_ZANCU|nr:hypothetical protein AX774_g6073 [Zancudomyces culisetae]|eukprot:OMH80490.1 hypothetical protein AX774_g6073 [Zancudomyces culisetae]